MQVHSIEAELGCSLPARIKIPGVDEVMNVYKLAVFTGDRFLNPLFLRASTPFQPPAAPPPDAASAPVDTASSCDPPDPATPEQSNSGRVTKRPAPAASEHSEHVDSTTVAAPKRLRFICSTTDNHPPAPEATPTSPPARCSLPSSTSDTLANPPPTSTAPLVPADNPTLEGRGKRLRVSCSSSLGAVDPGRQPRRRLMQPVSADSGKDSDSSTGSEIGLPPDEQQAAALLVAIMDGRAPHRLCAAEVVSLVGLAKFFMADGILKRLGLYLQPMLLQMPLEEVRTGCIVLMQNIHFNGFLPKPCS
jgi:hypothetical protein